jgi:glycerophosphoryl diester phosphodiesterase
LKRLLWATVLVLTASVIGYWWFANWIPADFHVENLSDGNIAVLGHGGNGFFSSEPINSLEGFRKLMTTGANGSEVDVQLTKDSVLVAFHDGLLNSSANCSGLIIQHDMASLDSCRREGGIPTLKEVLDLGFPAGSVLSFDLKHHGLDTLQEQTFARQLKKTVDAYPQYTILLESTNVPFMLHLKQAGLSNIYVYCVEAKVGLRTCSEHGFDGISIHNELITEEDVKLLHSKGTRVMIWGTRYWHQNREALMKSPDAIQSDNVSQLLQLLKR